MPSVFARSSVTRFSGSPASSFTTFTVGMVLNISTTESTDMSPIVWINSGRSVAAPIAL